MNTSTQLKSHPTASQRLAETNVEEHFPPDSITVAAVNGSKGGWPVATTSEIDSYAQELYAEVHDHASEDDGAMYLHEAFSDLVLDSLEEEGIWPGSQLAYLDKRGLGLSAWAIEGEGNQTLFLSISEFNNSDVVGTLSKTDVNAIFRRLVNFFERCAEGRFEISEHSPVKDIVDVIHRGDEFTEVRLFLLTNKTVRVDDPEPIEVLGIPLSFKVWDLESIRRARASGVELEPIDIDFKSRFGQGLPYLAASQGDGDIQTYLAFVPGDVIASLYQEFGPRLLERNVRAFLMAKTKVNRGIRDTLASEPEKFLAYNNGLTATAGEVWLDQPNGTPEISRIRDLQIVNGGQTTASIAAAAKDPEVNIEEVAVQVKLAVVDPEVIEELVPNISRYANSQNSISEDDLAANDEYLVNLEKASRTLYTPAVSGAKPTRWYFERAKGSYNVDKNRSGTAAQQKKFAKEHPPSQKIVKSSLALYENTWAVLPHIVCRGGQKNFVEFVERQGDIENLSTNEYQQRFKRLAAKAKLFKTTDSLIHKSELGGSYKRPVTVYTLAYYLHHTNHAVDLDAIWKSQQISQPLQENLLDVAIALKSELLRSGQGKNISEWAKQEACWDHLQQCTFDFRNSPEEIDPINDVEEPDAPLIVDPGEGVPLLQTIGENLGVSLEGKILKRFKTPTWHYLGDTGITNQGDPLHAFRSYKPTSDGSLKIETAFVNEVSGLLTMEENLDAMLKDNLKPWIIH